jgi:regulator of sigma E protease
MAFWPDRASIRRYRLPEAVGATFEELGMVAQAVSSLPSQLIKGTVTPKDVRPVSVVGASQILTFFLQQSIEWKVAYPVLRGAAMISLALGVTNLLPIPAVDGGRIFFIFIETIRGRRIEPEREAVIHFVGLMILIVLMGMVMVYDLIDPVISWSWLSR